ALAAASFGPGGAEIFGVGRDDHQVYKTTFDSSGHFVSGWGLAAPGNAFVSVSTVSRPNGTIELFALRNDHKLFGAKSDNTDSPASGFFRVAGAGPTPSDLTTAAALPDNTNNAKAFALPHDPPHQPFTAMFNSAGTLTSGWTSLSPDEFSTLSA